MEGNLWLDKYKDSFPFIIEKDKIIADKSFEGTGMVVITAMPNPQNYKKPLLIYTAQESNDVLGINQIFHGPTDFVIAKGQEEIHSGYYQKNQGKWTFSE